MKTEKLSAGKLVFTEGTPGEEAYRILEGRVEISIAENGQRLVLATLGAGEIFGEMAMIENRPRSASARVLEAAHLEVITREDFGLVLAKGGEPLVPYLTTIFDRLRVTNDRLMTALDQLDRLEPISGRRRQETFEDEQSRLLLQIDADSDEMGQQSALQGRVVQHFPFYFGRRAALAGVEAVIQNQLLVADRHPYRVSRKHCLMGRSGDSVFIEDRTSKLGTIVNGIRIGGKSREARVRLSPGENSLVLGGVDSQVRFKITMSDATAGLASDDCHSS
jgi:CRP-like cAMP-binding protein